MLSTRFIKLRFISILETYFVPRFHYMTSQGANQLLVDEISYVVIKIFFKKEKWNDIVDCSLKLSC